VLLIPLLHKYFSVVRQLTDHTNQDKKWEF
jgi:hypothetical protein